MKPNQFAKIISVLLLLPCILISIGIAAGLGLLGGDLLSRKDHLKIFSPRPKETSADLQSYLQDLNPEYIQSIYKEFASRPIRYPGSPAFDETADWIKGRLENAGLKVVEQIYPLASPVTLRREIRNAATGEILPDAEVYPFFPHYIRTSSCRLEGEVIDGGESFLQNYDGKDIKNRIVLVDASVGKRWLNAAELGASAILVTLKESTPHEKLFEIPAAAPIRTPVLFLKSANAQSLVGQRVKLDVQVNWKTVAARNIFAVLPASSEKSLPEAFFFTASYDSGGLIPDIAEGASRAASAAQLLAMAETLARTKTHQRPLAFLFHAGETFTQAGIRNFMMAIGHHNIATRKQTRNYQQKHSLRANDELAFAVVALRTANRDRWWKITDTLEERRLLDSIKSKAVAKLMVDEFRYAMEQELDVALAAATLSQSEWLEAGRPSSGPVFDAMRRDQKNVTAQRELVLIEPARVRAQASPEKLQQIRERVIQGLQRLVDSRTLALNCVNSELQVAELFDTIGRILPIELDTSAVSRKFIVGSGDDTAGAARLVRPFSEEFSLEAQRVIDLMDPKYVGNKQDLFVNAIVGHQNRRESELIGRTYDYIGQSYIKRTSRYMVVFSTRNDNRSILGTPLDSFQNMDPANIVAPAQILGGTLLVLNSRSKSLVPDINFSNTLEDESKRLSFRADVMQSSAAGIGVPNRKTPDTVVQMIPMKHDPDPKTEPIASFINGVYTIPTAITDYDRSMVIFPYAGMRGGDAAYKNRFVEWRALKLHPETGDVMLSQDEGNITKSKTYISRKRFDEMKKSTVHLVMFPCAQVDVFHPYQSTTFSSFTEIQPIDLRTDSPLESYMVVREYDKVATLFVKPELRFGIGFSINNPQNPTLRQIGAFATNPRFERGTRGYHPLETHSISFLGLDIALSMASVNEDRLRVQEAYEIKNPELSSLISEAKTSQTAASDYLEEKQYSKARLAADAAVVNQILAYPRIKAQTSDALKSVVFYMFLLLPFSYFLERLFVASTKVQHQLVGAGLIFLVSFALLYWVHPGLSLASSPFVVLLGFVTMALTLMVSIFLMSKFQNSMQQLKKAAFGEVQAAEVSKAAASNAAFALGVSNLRKRATRTGMTCTTLILITFTILCFTSPTPSVREDFAPLGDAKYSGLLYRDINFKSIDGEQHFLSTFGTNAIVSPRRWIVGSISSRSDGNINVQLLRKRQITVELDGKISTLACIIGLSTIENKITNPAESLVAGRWFENDEEKVVILPDKVSAALGIKYPDLGNARIQIDGEWRTVIGVFDSEKLTRIRDLDGDPITPYDVNSTQQDSDSTMPESEITLPPSVPRVNANNIAIVPVRSMPPQKGMLKSLAIAFDESAMGVKGVRDQVFGMLTRFEKPFFFAYGGNSFFGARTPRLGVAGMAAVLVPLIIAGLIVFNTMLGSVYERTGEIAVYSSVGLAPQHILWLFIAEAGVFATLGAISGYLLGQLLAKLMVFLGLGSGLNLNYTSLSAMYSTILVILMTLISAIFPARKAFKLAAPSDQRTIQIKLDPEQDELTLALPFTFGATEAKPALAYIYQYYESCQEGGVGEFISSPPLCGLKVENGGQSYFLESRCWLPPYDLGISQDICISINNSENPKIFVATLRIKHISGEHQDWERMLKAYVKAVRKHILAWRAISQDEKAKLAVQADSLLAKSVAK